MPIAKEGLREIAGITLVLGAMGFGATMLHWVVAVPFVVVWLWVLWFFRDPHRHGLYEVGELCSAADGVVTEITDLDQHELIDGPAVRVGVFLSLFNVHANRSPCSGRVTTVTYQAGQFLDARHPDSGRLNESNTVVMAPNGPMPGPIAVRQVAGLVARRIVCHAGEGDELAIGERFGMIKFGSRTELVIPRREGTEIRVKIGDKVRAGITIIARQRIEADARQAGGESHSPNSQPVTIEASHE